MIKLESKVRVIDCKEYECFRFNYPDIYIVCGIIRDEFWKETKLFLRRTLDDKHLGWFSSNHFEEVKEEQMEETKYILTLISRIGKLTSWNYLDLKIVILQLKVYNPNINQIVLYKITEDGVRWVNPEKFPFEKKAHTTYTYEAK